METVASSITHEGFSYVPCLTRTCRILPFPPVSSPRGACYSGASPPSLSSTFSWTTHHWDNTVGTLAPDFFRLAWSLWFYSYCYMHQPFTPFLMLCRKYTIVGFSSFFPSRIDRHLGYFQFVAILNKDTMTRNFVWTYFHFLGQIPKSRIPESQELLI